MLLTIVGTLFAFMGTEAATRALSMSAADIWNTSSYDLSIAGPSAFSISKRVGEVVGVRSTEDVYRMPAIVNWNAGEVLVAGDGRIMAPKYASGREPQTEQEIVVPSFIAERDLLEIGSEVTLSKTDGDARAVVYEVCGTILDQACVVTKEGLTRLEPSPEQYQIGSVAGTYAFRLGNVSTLIARNGGPMRDVGIASLLLAAIVSYRTSHSAVTQLLRTDR